MIVCTCKNISPQTKECYDNMITVAIPKHMYAYAEARKVEGLSNLISIDPCILEELKFLWSKGVITYGSCCGHNIFGAFVNVDDGSVKIMESLKYELIKANTFKL